MNFLINIHSLLKKNEDGKLICKNQNKKLIEFIKKKNKDAKIYVYCSDIDNKKASYFLAENGIIYDDVIDKFDDSMIYISENAHNINKNNLRNQAYSLLKIEKYLFKEGDIVELKSGSFPMVINFIKPKEKIASVKYFDFDGMISEFDINFSCLKKSKKNWHQLLKDEENKPEEEEED